ncbi:hypothetical protein ACRALDRAFT_1070916 [Sodiomyces alcalophilus JCM 7366]|uniref:uncharacterized protein n=1 Tax=Sodiomyces alcalophilus JCM 7366 TaxID=591952 RepID=UPI0039B3652C
MDPIFLRNLNYFTGQNLPPNAVQPPGPSIAGVPRDPNDIALWDALVAQDLAASASTSNIPFAQQHAAGYHHPYRNSIPQQPTPNTFKRHAPSDSDPTIASQRQRVGHERKRTRIDSNAGPSEPADPWLQFNDDEMDNGLGGSFEIDFSRRQNYPSGFGGYGRPTSRLNPLPTTPGLGTGLYANPTFKDEFEFDDGALDNVLSDDEDLFDSINLGEQMSSIDAQPPSEVPPREGLYSTPLSWEKPVPGLPMNPPLFGIGTPMLDPEQRRLLAIALNAGGSSSTGLGLGTGDDIESEHSNLGRRRSTTATANPSEISKGGEDETPKSKGKELRNAVPSLRSIRGGDDEDGDGEDQPRGAPKVSKAFEQLLTSTARQPFPMPTYSRTLFDPRGFC